MVLPAHSNPEAPVLSQFSLAGKAALVTGGCRGIGLEVARGLAEAGAKVAITYTSTKPEEANAVAEQVSKAGNGVLVRAYKCDVRNKDDVEETVEQVTRDLGGALHVCIANAGIVAHTAALEYGEKEFKDMVDVNLYGAFWTTQAAAKVFKQQVEAGQKTAGSIVITASVSGILVNIPQQQAAYNASKSAVIHLAKSLAVEWVDFARVNCISPGFIATDMIAQLDESWQKKWPELIPGTRFCQAAELKGAYVYLASEASSYMTGANLVIDGGYTLP
ncbi:gluconate 5-dehydrogenase [Fusarium oxysporum f. sp. radicis-lycopersici 26381]|uniref:Oxidoreductase n=2 Tax=Fusarium oxysporum TaxID=5507 RepID=A0A8H5EDM5_FUSOX|nr:gluconate 5-dehydrogenase [Fusarium oxysporum f. sp. radicis-lycopersici 26381]KAF5256984.1 hypothetical protein FOXYS1_12511 [Fusarium oxysporum]RKK22791.1 hypothetical protein BFJ65_g5382 [Fusarium oxysporum f. sp. cepae]RKK39818.1 hypothetical protein BFJ66_g11826 [Fusarium oxysporum f. sp. cepae]RKK48414.1 hypothetical protein BFJ67_g7336 [Fusarium oxysporum f. sp. cepae]